MLKRKLISVFLSIVILSILTSCSQTTQTTGAIRLVNNSSFPITGFYITPISAPTWGVNQLGSNTVYSGYSFTVQSIPAGFYDLAAYLYGYGAVYHYNAEVKAGYTATWTLSDPKSSSSKGLNETLEQIEE